MTIEANKEVISGFINNYLADSPDIFLVQIKISATNDTRIFIDADKGVTIQKCAELNRALYKFLEENEVFAGNNFSVEVSSPGVDEPLKLHRQYVKNIGRNIKVELNDDKTVSGKLIAVEENEIIIEQKTGKPGKAITNTETIFFNQIKQTTVLITF